MYTYNAKLVNVVDGDTQDFLVDLGFGLSYKMRIRLFGVDTPEIFHPSCQAEKEHGLDAKMFVERYLNTNVVLKTKKDKTGKYGRYLADFYISGISITKKLREAGFEKRTEYGA